MAWEPEIEELRAREAFADQMGGDEKVERQHHYGKLTIRERLDAVVDEGSFHEFGKTAGVASYDDAGKLIELRPSNFVFGTARIDGRPVIVSGDDFTVRGGSADASIIGKRLMSEGMAEELRLPHVRLIDGMGGGGSVKTIETAGRTYIPEIRGWDTIVRHLGVAPSVSLALGSVAGIGAARVATSHYSVIVRDTAQMMIAGPALVKWAALGDVSKEELGHADIHTGNGAIDDVAESEQDAFEMASRFLSYLPTNVDEIPERVETGDDPAYRDESLISIVPRNPKQTYDMRAIIEAAVDEDSYFEIGRDWGKSVITGLCRLDGYSIAMFAEDPRFYGGGWTSDSSRKLIRLCDLASTFHLPIVHLEDCPGFVIGKQAEQDAAIRFGSAALAALGQAPVPFACVVIRKAFGVAGAANKKPGSFSFRCAWPSGDWGSLPVEGGVEVAYKAELAAADDPSQLLEEITDRLNRVRSPHRAAEFFEIEEIIDPRDTRKVLCEWAGLVQRSLVTGPVGFSYRP